MNMNMNMREQVHLCGHCDVKITVYSIDQISLLYCYLGPHCPVHMLRLLPETISKR